MQKERTLKQFLSPAAYSAAIIMITAVILFSKISQNGLPYFDDAYYGQKAKEMMSFNNPWVPHFAGKPAYDNPPMHFWILAGMFNLAGISEFSARFSSAVFVLLLMVLGYRMAVFVFKDKWAGFFAVLALALTNYIARQGFRCMLDVTLIFFEMLSLYLFMLANDKKKLYFFMLSGIFTGFAMLTKSALGFYPAVIIVLYYVISGKAVRLVSTGFLVFLASCLAVFLPWVAANYIFAGPHFFKVHFAGIIGDAAAGNSGKLNFTLAYLKVMFSYGLPWMPLAVYGTYEMVRQEWKKGGDNIFLILPLTAWVIMLLLTFSAIPKSWYVMPSYFACAMISAYLLFKWIKNAGKAAFISTAVYAVIAIVLVVLPVSLNSKKSNEIKALAPFVRTLVPAGGEVLNYRMPYWVVMNPLIFYTDRTLSQSVETVEGLLKELETGRIAIAYQKYYDSDLAKYADKITEIARAGDKILFCKKGLLDNLKSPVFFLPKP